MSLFVVFFLPVLCSLGLWQMSRAAEKEDLQMQFMAQMTALPTMIHESKLNSFARVKLKGTYEPEMYLLDNQVHAGEVGYWVVQVFLHHANQNRYLVNRGFVPAGKDRAELPMVSTPTADEVVLVGHVWPFTGLLPLLDAAQEIDEQSEDSAATLSPTAAWPKRIQRLNTQLMGKLAAAENLEIRLEAGQPGVQVAAAFAQVLEKDKHLGYAATWFGLAVTLLIGFLVYGSRAAQSEKQQT